MSGRRRPGHVLIGSLLAIGDATRGLTTVCCFGGGRATRLFLSGTGLTGASSEIGNYPPGNMKSFQQLEGFATFGPDDYIVTTTTGIFVTFDVGAATPLKLTTDVRVTPDVLPFAAPNPPRPKGFLSR